MEKGICNLSVIPVRENPSDRSQMTNQLLFGETVEIDDVFKNWYFVRSEHDGYQGWIDKKQIAVINDYVYEKYNSNERIVVSSKTAIVSNNSGDNILLSFGSKLLNVKESSLKDFEVQILEGSVSSKPENGGAQQLKEYALMFKNVPYLWGGRSFFGVDCSGFTQLVYMTAGYDLPRDSKQQVKSGKDIYLFEEAQSGDLLFFGDEESDITHVGIFLGNGKIIHASGMVRIDSIDHYGIYNVEIENYTHKLRAIQRIL
jgi:cell wall-associated NlpC family hydrolase